VDVVKKNLIKWINSVSLDKTTGVFNIAFNDSTKYDASLTWVKDILLAADGTLTFKYTD